MRTMRIRSLIGIALTSTAVLNLEIALTRIFSVMMWYHFAFMAISLALLGSGAAGVWLYLAQRRFPPERTPERLALLATAFSLAAVGCLVLYMRLPFDVQTMDQGVDWAAAGWLALTYLLLAVPFFFGGATIALAVSRFGAAVGRVYFLDLAGASAGCLLSIIALSALGGVLSGLIGVLLRHLLLLPSLLRRTQPWGLAGRVGLCTGALFPTGLLVGQPFPLGVRWAHSRASEAIPWMWAVNGAASVIGSTIATAVALRAGFRMVSLAGMLCYGAALLLVAAFWQRMPAVGAARARRAAAWLRRAPLVRARLTGASGSRSRFAERLSCSQ